MNQSESVKLKESIKSTKQEPMDHHQSRYCPRLLALFVSDRLELNLLKQLSTNTHEHMIFRILEGLSQY